MANTAPARVARNDAFSVDLGAAASNWISVSELTSEIDVSVEETSGKDSKQSIRAIPGERKTNDLTLTRYANGDKTLSDWYDAVARDGKLGDHRKNITIKVFDPEQKPVAEVNVIGCIPTSLKYSDFTAQNPDLQTEEITLAYETWERVS
jgi:phage tail-like protein